MFTLLKFIDKTRLLHVELPAFCISLILAENLYKFGSFTLESMSFIGTWMSIGYIIDRLIKHRTK